MKDMSNRDKMILIIITVIIILVAGFFALIKPTYENYMADIDTYNSTKTEYDGIQQKLNAIPDLQNGITGVYNDAKKTAQVFVNEAFADVNSGYATNDLNLAVDEHIQAALDASELEVQTLSLSGATATQLSYYYYTPNVVTYALLEAADVNGNYAADVSELLFDSVILSEKDTIEVMTNTVTLSVSGTKANLMSFLDAIKEDKNAILITNVSISDYTFSGGLDEEEAPAPQPTAPPEPTEPQFDEEGNPIEVPEEPTEAPTPAPTPTPSGDGELGEGYSAMNLNVVFYNAKAIDEPYLGD